MSESSQSPSSDMLDTQFRRSIDDALGAPRAGDAELLDRVKERVMGAVRRGIGPTHRTIRAGAGSWELVAPGIERKLLWESGDAFSCLMRLAPGAVATRHSHALDEECVVLEGTLRIGADLLLSAGDFHVGVQGLDHEDASTETGAVVYLRGAKPQLDRVV